MNFGWKFLLPVAILNIIFTATMAYFISLVEEGRA